MSNYWLKKEEKFERKFHFTLDKIREQRFDLTARCMASIETHHYQMTSAKMLREILKSI